MTSKDGEWILVDMNMTITVAVKMVTSVMIDNDASNTDLAFAFSYLRAIQNLYYSLQVFITIYVMHLQCLVKIIMLAQLRFY